MPTHSNWTTSGPNILAPDTLKRVQHALSEGWIGGMHLFLGGGGPGDIVAFDRYGDFISHVTASRPGDLFLLWSVAEMRQREMLLVDKSYGDFTKEPRTSMLTAKDIKNIRDYLSQAKLNEILCISCKGDSRLSALLTDLDGTYEDKFLEVAQAPLFAGGAIAVLPFTEIDKPEFYLTKSKRPNEKGEVLLGGAY